MDLRILGPLEISLADGPVEVRAAKVRTLLAMLIVHANEVVSTERLIDAIWAGSPPVSAANTLHGYVSQLRNLLEPDRQTAHPKVLHTRPPGYVLQVERDSIDVWRFEQLAGAGRRALAAGDASHATKVLAEALALWRGEALTEFEYAEFAHETITRLEELRHSTEEDRMEAELMLGHHVEALGDIKALTAAAPLRERRWKQLIVALYRVGHQAEALRAYQALRRTLADELGVDPSPDLKRLEAAVLAQDPTLEHTLSAPFAPAGATPTTPAPLPSGLRHVGEIAFVARDLELALLGTERERSTAGEQRLVLVEGEPGVGKTRLAAEAALAAAGTGATVLMGRCDAELAIPYQPFGEALADMMRRCRPEERRRLLGPYRESSSDLYQSSVPMSRTYHCHSRRIPRPSAIDCSTR